MADRTAARDIGEDTLTYKGQTWKVESAPVVVESDGASVLVEVWVERGEGIEQPQ